MLDNILDQNLDLVYRHKPVIFYYLHMVKLNNINQLEQLLIKEKKSPLVDSAVEELWIVLNNRENKNINLNTDQIINYYTSICRYENYSKNN